MKYWGEIDGIKMYEINPEKKNEAFKRGLTVLAKLNLEKLRKSVNNTVLQAKTKIKSEV